MARKKKKILFYLRSYIVIGVFAGFTALTVYIANFFVNRPQNLVTRATVGTAQVFFEPGETRVAGETVVNIWVTTDKPLAFANVEIGYDPAMVTLNQEIEIKTQVLSRQIRLSSRADANLSGRAVVTIALPPDSTTPAPNGTFAIASLRVIPKVSTANVTTELSFDLTKSQLVDTEALAFTTTATAGQLTLNPQATNSPIASPAPTLNTIRLYPAADAKVDASRPRTNYGTARYLSMDKKPVTLTYMTFNLNGLADKEIKSAKLRTKVVNSAPTSSRQNILLIPDTTWQETMITYNSRPSTGRNIGSFSGGNSGSYVEADLTEAVTQYKGQMLSFAIDSNVNDGLDFASRESNYKPELVVTY